MADQLTIFYRGDLVLIDGNGEGCVIERLGDNYSVEIVDADYMAEISGDRLSLLRSQPPASASSASVLSATASSARTKQDSTSDHPRPTRFMNVNDDDIEKILKEQENKNTALKTLRDINLVRQFISTNGDQREIHDIPPQELNILLCKFVISVRKQNGENYETTTVRCMRGSIERYLRRHNYGYTLLNSIEFSKFRDVLTAKLKELKSSGKGNLPYRSDEITDDEIDQLWNSGQLGTSTPDAILNTLWYNNTIHFGFRGCDEHKKMKWGDVEVGVDSDGREYLSFTERSTKTRQGVDNNSRLVAPKMWSTPEIPDRCPVALYHLYAKLRPVSYCNPDSEFYVSTVTTKNPSPSDRWFKAQNVGVHKLETIMKRMATNAGLSKSKKLTNHSARKHLVQKLNDANIPPSMIMQVSGHKNIQSINNYSRINTNQHRTISNILSGTRQESWSAPFQHSSTTNTHLDLHNTVNRSTNRTDVMKSIFTNSTISGGSFTINVNNNYASESQPSTSNKRKRPVIDSDTD